VGAQAELVGAQAELVGAQAELVGAQAENDPATVDEVSTITRRATTRVAPTIEKTRSLQQRQL